MKAQKSPSTRNGSAKHAATARNLSFSDVLANKVESAGDSLAAYVEKAGEGMRGLGDQISTVASDVMEQSSKAGQKATAYVRANPGKSFAVALAAGYIVARLMRRRSNAQ